MQIDFQSTDPWAIRVFVAFLILVAIASYEWLRRQMAFLSLRHRTGCAYPPSYPHKDPIFGYDLYRQRQQALKEGYNMSLYMRDFRRLGHTWQETSLTTQVVNVMDPVNLQYIHSTAVEDFGRLVNRPSNAKILGSGIFLADGKRWRRSRDLIKPIFARAEVGNMEFLERHVDQFIKQLPKDGSAFDLQPRIKRLVLDLTTEFLLGKSIGAQQNDQNASDFLQTFDQVLLGWNKRRQAGVLAARYIFDRKWLAAVGRLYSYLDKQVERVLEETSMATSLTSEEKEPSAGRYILLPELAKYVRDPVALRFEVLNVFIPSRDTTSALFGNLFWVLSRHPEEWQKLRRCVANVQFNDSMPPAVALVNLAALRPLRYVIYETLRAIGPTGRQFRVARRDTVLPRGGGPDGAAPAFVARGTVICSIGYGTHHDRDVWGPDADEFRPARWAEAEEMDTTGRPPWTFIPFLGGPHVCPAQQQVIVQATYLLLRMVQTFESIECRDEVREYVEVQRMVIESRRGVQIALKAEQSAE